MRELMDSWLCGNKKDVAMDLLSRGPGDIALFAGLLVTQNIGKDATHGYHQVEHLAAMMDSLLDDRIPKYEPPQTPW